MSTELSKDEVNKLCQDLVYKVAYAFYDSPITEKKLGEILNVGPNDVRKYLANPSYVNKEKIAVNTQSNWVPRGGREQPQRKSRDVIYWYLDYREFSDVVKYRIAMMRKAIDEKLKQEVGKRGYVCSNCGKGYDPLEISNTFDPRTNLFLCELCGGELVEDDPSTHTADGQAAAGDQMQRFNLATAPIRDALKQIEGQRLPTINMVAWIAKNVVTDVPDGKEEDTESRKRKIDVVFDAEDDSEEKERLAQEQRQQNALPDWHLKSTVTGDATTLGIKEAAAERNRASEGPVSKKEKIADDDDDLAAHYANMENDDEDEMEDADEPELAQESSIEPTPDDTPAPAGDDDVMVSVGGVMKPLLDVTEADQDEMTPAEYEAYAAAMGF
ncbi:transcription initiation factor TFIIE alpha subunit [Trichosporon asahii var. asahii CBS 2479]|uniref:Transcription initiation factor TFIIE alpha subunit n=1 Tax=Trichosporon asahii var. asahii (strain ATCC 90039 / CBS 2479 / JCM 2466 / KCTC 7840 / NBRC 103889/ NCYC 2677 / UAMH 7654) TaxID=1186058 RepID=J4UFC0_TRIAS|nr:transcription initiation factor TFIIE alpha subunit [Trichosporon asahii var. asahii CBS 2479]EJT50035.1 transcription initiation factor TFIIE alpha subunit [Trichosporon asahii var. asahii CBS 2479]